MQSSSHPSGLPSYAAVNRYPQQNNFNNNNNNMNNHLQQTAYSPQTVSPLSSASSYQPSYSTYNNAGVTGSTTGARRVRTPHAHDVLSGRGGGINAHSGNIQFREWVRERKNEYNLASSKTEKARVANEVITLVTSQNPPGRFLQKENAASSTGCSWVELDEERIMAKTSQALREGAPQIRAAHRDELEQNKSSRKSKPRKRNNTQVAAPSPVPPPHVPSTIQQKAVDSLHANVEAAKKALEQSHLYNVNNNNNNNNNSTAVNNNNNNIHHTDYSKRQRVGYNTAVNPHLHQPTLNDESLETLPSFDTPRMMQPPKNVPAQQYLQTQQAQGPRSATISNSSIAPPPPEPRPLGYAGNSSSSFKRINSLALSDFSVSDSWHDSAFVNPFEEENNNNNNNGNGTSRRSSWYRDTSNNIANSNPDFSALNALFRSDSSRSNNSYRSSVNQLPKSRRNSGNDDQFDSTELLKSLLEGDSEEFQAKIRSSLPPRNTSVVSPVHMDTSVN